MAKTVNRLTNEQYFDLANYMLARAGEEKKISRKTVPFAKEAAEVVGFPVTRGHVFRVAKAHGIEMMITNQPPRKKANGSAEIPEDINFRLDNIERKLNLIMSWFDIKWVE